MSEKISNFREWLNETQDGETDEFTQQIRVALARTDQALRSGPPDQHNFQKGMQQGLITAYNIYSNLQPKPSRFGLGTK